MKLDSDMKSSRCRSMDCLLRIPLFAFNQHYVNSGAVRRVECRDRGWRHRQPVVRWKLLLSDSSEDKIAESTGSHEN